MMLFVVGLVTSILGVVLGVFMAEKDAEMVKGWAQEGATREYFEDYERINKKWADWPNMDEHQKLQHFRMLGTLEGRKYFDERLDLGMIANISPPRPPHEIADDIQT